MALFTLVGTLRIALTYLDKAQAFDEPCHVAAAIELLDKGTYTLDPVHPPLSRIAIGIPLYLAGARFPAWAANDPRLDNYNDVGNEILNRGGHYVRRLALARLAMLPFFAATAVMVFLWARREFGVFAALIAIALFTTTPSVLAFAGLAYTDMAAACTQFAAIFAFANWLDNPDRKASLLLGFTCGLAFLTKPTSVLFLPGAGLAILACKLFLGPHQKSRKDSRWLPSLLAAAALSMAVVWAGYGFSVDRVQRGLQLSPQAMPTFQHFPQPVREIARRAILSNIRIPAPALIRAAAQIWVLNHDSPPAYLLGKIKNGGWWYFFIVGLAVKAPIPLLALAVLGLNAILLRLRSRDWKAAAPLAAIFAVLLVTMPVKYNAGTRHVLIIWPLLALIAGAGATWLWQLSSRRWRLAGRFLVAVLLLWQAVESARAQSDFIAYFNQFAGRDPSRVLVAGCDLDCGQDLFRLSQALRERNITDFSLAMWTSADMTQPLGLPRSYQVLQPYQPTTGWVAISLRSMRFGDVFHHTYPPDSLRWIERYQPVEEIGKTILLFYVPKNLHRP